MSRILIAGCGYVGVAAADLFHENGWQVEGWTASEHSARELGGKPYPVRPVDITDPGAVSRPDARFDAVIQCVSSGGGGAEAYRRIYLAGARNLAAAFPGALLVYTSSTSVYAQTGGEWVTETSAADPTTETGRVLRETEEFVLSGGGVVARLAGIYGPGRSALLRKFLAGTATIDSATPRFINQAHRDDIAAALLVLVQQHAAGRSDAGELRIYNVADGHPVLERECYGWLADRFERPLPPVAAGPVERKRGNSNKRVSSEKLQAAGWRLQYPTFEEAMVKSILPNLHSLGC
jgi:nucleoside-diphosphate-sugar epimerase